MKKILFLFTSNQYNVVNEMVWRIADYLEQRCGCQVGRYRLDDYEKVCNGDWDIVFSAQGIEFSKLKEADGRIHITWLVDHPRYLIERFGHYSQIEKVYVGCVDRTHVDYLKRYYNLPHVFFAPHFGWKAEDIMPYEKRTCEVFFPASYTRFEEDVACRYRGLDGALKVIVDKTIDFLQEHTEYSLEGGLETVLQQFGEKDYLDLSKCCMEVAGEYIDAYLRSTMREQVLRALLAKGVNVTVCGKKWSLFPLNEEEQKHLTILSEELSYTQVIEQMARSKVVLNVMPWFKDGSHERVVMGAMNGAISATDGSIYVNEIWGEKGALIYNLKQPELLAEQLKELLADQERTAEMAATGAQAAEKHATVEIWGEFLKEIISE